MITQLHQALFWRALICLLLTVLADFLFFDHTIGWTIGLFACLLNISIAISHRSVFHSVFTKCLLAFNILLGLALIESPSTLAIIMIALGTMCFVVYAYSPVNNAYILGTQILKWLCQCYRPFLEDMIVLLSKYSIKSNRKKFINNWCLPLILSVVFMTFFSASNPIISGWFIHIGEFLSKLSYVRIVFWLAVIVICWSCFLPKIAQVKLAPSNSLVSIGPQTSMVLRALILFNAIFLIQTGLDISYLWLGAQLPENMSYAEYAHKGAYPLIFTAFMAGIFVLYALRPGGECEKIPCIRWLVYFWIGQNILLVFSSIWRTTLYIEVYALTYLRVSALVWMGLVALGLSWIVVRILLKKSSTWLINVNVITLCCVLLICSFINFGGIIANYNVKHCYEVSGQGATLDLFYLKSLGVEALPAMDWLQKNASDAFPYNSVNGIKIQLARSTLGGKLSSDLQHWRGWTYRKQRIFQRVGAIEPFIQLDKAK